MSRETSPYIVGDFWLDKRRDGKSPEVWQIAWYHPATRSICYKSTRCRSLDDAKPLIQAHNAGAISKGPQRPEDALVVPLLMLYWDEHGKKAIGKAQIASSLRQFIAFLDQDRATVGVTVAQLDPPLFIRFQEWRMGPHSYELEWKEKMFRHSSKGVNGESVQRNLDDIRAALSHHAGHHSRLPYAPKVPAVIATLRSPARDRVLTDEELGAIIGFARSDKAMLRFVLLMLATAVRPEAAMKFNPKQWKRKEGLVDLHPPGAPRTKKHNPVVPVIPEFVPILEEWAKDKAAAVKSKKTSWRTLRRALGLPDDVFPKTIRHTVATRLRSKGALPSEISSLLGHVVMKGSSAVYAKYDPNFMGTVKAALSTIWTEAMEAADLWDAGHLRAKQGNRQTIVIDKNVKEVQISGA